MENYPKFYRKAVKGNVGGLCLNKKQEVMEYLLKGDPFSNKTDLENITVEIFDEDGEKFFLKKNKGAIQNGYLISVGEFEIEVDETNAVSDGYLKDLLKEPWGKLIKRVNEFTSPTPVYRLLEFANEANKPIKTITFLKEKAAELEHKSMIHNSITDGTTMVKTVG